MMRLKLIFYWSLLVLYSSCPLVAQKLPNGEAYSKLSTGMETLKDSAGIQLALKVISKDIQSPDTAMQLLRNLLQQSRSISFHTGAVRALQQLSDIQYKKGAFQGSLEYALQAADIAKQYPHCHRFLASVYNTAGKAHDRLGNTLEAARYYYLALAAKEKYPESAISLEKIYINMSSLPLGEHLQNTLSQKAEHYARLHKDYANLGIILMNRAGIFNKNKNYDESRRLLNEAFALGITHKDTFLQYRALVQIASLLLYQEKTDSALACILKAKSISPAGDKNDIGLTYYVEYLTGEIYLKMKYYGQAESYIEHAWESARSMQLKYLEEISSRALAYIYYRAGRYKEAYEMDGRYQELKDSSLNQKIAADINQMEIRYRSVEKDKNLAQNKVRMMQQEQLLKQKNLWIGIIVAAVVLSALMLIIFWRNKRKLEAQKIKSERLQALMNGEEQERSRMARELHDGIGGMLAGIKMNVTALQDKEEMRELKAGLQHVIGLMTTMSTEIHRTAHNLMPELLDKYGFRQALTTYCQQLEEGRKLRIDVQFLDNGAVMPKNFALPLFRIIQELLQNIIKHARADKAIIQVQATSDSFFLSVEDDGKGFNLNSYKKGFGLENIRNRVAALGGICTIESEPGKGTLVFIELSINNNRAE